MACCELCIFLFDEGTPVKLGQLFIGRPVEILGYVAVSDGVNLARTSFRSVIRIETLSEDTSSDRERPCPLSSVNSELKPVY